MGIYHVLSTHIHLPIAWVHCSSLILFQVAVDLMLDLFCLGLGSVTKPIVPKELDPRPPLVQL